MEYLTPVGASILQHWPIWVVSALLVLAAAIDGLLLKVPNWLTFPMILSGWSYSLFCFGWSGLGASLLGTLAGLALLLPAYAIGGMGAGDVKLLAGLGAWIHATQTFYAFCASAIVGGIIASVMVMCRRSRGNHVSQFWMILTEILTIRDPNQLSDIAAQRKSSMLLLPYGIPIAIGTIAYFAWEGMLL